MSELLNFGEYTPFILSSYGVVAVVMLYVAISSYRTWGRLQKEVDRLKGTKSAETDPNANTDPNDSMES